MKRIKHAITLASLVAVSALSLYGCGGETPTSTPVPPTVTTVMEAPTATSAVEVAPTSTTSVAGASTATTASTGNTGSGGSVSGSGSASDILKNSAHAMKGVKSYHVVLKTEAAGVNFAAEGDFVLPDKARLNMDTGAGKAEIILIGNSMYSQVPGSDSYIELPSTSSPLGASTDTSAFADLAENATVVGDETMDGVDTTHVKFSYSADKAMAMAAQASGQALPTPSSPLGEVNADLWIEKSTGYVHQFQSSSSVAGTQSKTTITYSKFNEDVTPPIEKPTNIQQMPSIPTIASP